MNQNFTQHGYEDDEYIDMELLSINSSPQSTEFEFTCNDKGSNTSSADELFRNGKLLPLHLHLPPVAAAALNITKEAFRLQKQQPEEDYMYYTMHRLPPKCPTAPCTNTANTPSDSANISPSESCRASCELNPDDYFFEWSTELTSFINSSHPEKRSTSSSNNWCKKLKLIKHSILGHHRMRGSRAYLKSLFSKSDPCAKANDVNSLRNDDPKQIQFMVVGRSPHPTIAAIIKDNEQEQRIQDCNVHRRSFSSAIKRHSPETCLSSSLSSSSSNSSSGASSSSSSFSLNSNGFNVHQLLRRSSSATEIKSSIEAAIAHCKKSQQVCNSSNSSKEPDLCSFPAVL